MKYLVIISVLVGAVPLVSCSVPEFMDSIPNVTVSLGRDASLPCVVTNLGVYKVAWVHIDRQMILTIHNHVITRIPRFSVSHDGHNTWLLHIAEVEREDKGFYMCQVNTEPMMHQVGYLEVVVPPEIIDEGTTGSGVQARENTNVTLTCIAEGYPEPKVTWRREDYQKIAVNKHSKEDYIEGPHLNLVRISRADMGAYLCIAANGVPPTVSKRIVLEVEFPPMIWVPNQLVGTPRNKAVTIECMTESFPRSINYWVRDDVMLMTSHKYRTEAETTSYQTHMKLTINYISADDYGTYKCVAKNSLGETEGTINLYEMQIPSASPRADEIRTGKETTEINTFKK